MDAEEALWTIGLIRESGRRLSEGAREFLTELTEDLEEGRKAVLTQEDCNDLWTICQRVGVPCPEDEMPEDVRRSTTF
jgi:hypothetical protein